MSNFHTFKIKVYYEDTDAGGIVYYARYLNFIERARTEMIYDHVKLNHARLKKEHNAVFVVRECNIKYHKSANFEDQLEIHTHVIKKTPVRLNLKQQVIRADDDTKENYIKGGNRVSGDSQIQITFKPKSDPNSYIGTRSANFRPNNY